MFLRRFALIFPLFVLAVSQPCYSCDRTVLLDMDRYIGDSAAIFIGELVTGKPSITSNPYWVQNRYQVLKVFKGDFVPGDVILLNERMPRRYYLPDSEYPTRELVTVYKVRTVYTRTQTDAFFRRDYDQTQCEIFNFTYPDLMQRLLREHGASSTVNP